MSEAFIPDSIIVFPPGKLENGVVLDLNLEGFIHESCLNKIADIEGMEKIQFIRKI